MSESILVVGGGTMGAGIAFVAARAGYSVNLIESNTGAWDDVNKRLAAAAQRTGDSNATGRIRLSATIPQQSDSALAIEAIPEDLALKRDVFAQLAAVLPKDAVLATNTSSLSVDEIAEGVAEPQRVLGIHFFNPPAAMQLVEIVHASQTSDDAIERAEAFAKQLGKTTVLAADTPGFIVNRVARPYYLQALRALQANIAAADELDALARGIGFRMGPFELMDLIGVDVNLATSQSIFERTGEDRLEPVELQYAMVAQGRLGRKSGSGFYDYSKGNPVHDDAPVPMPSEKNDIEHVVVTGYGSLADELFDALSAQFATCERIESDDLLEDLPEGATIVVEAGDGINDRTTVLQQLDSRLATEAVIFADAYTTSMAEAAKALAHPERLAGYGILWSVQQQDVVEVVDTDDVSDDALELAQDVFATIGKRVVLVENGPALFLGRVIASIINEAVIAVRDGVASADDVDTAMKLGTNYPIGPIEWGREIGGGRVRRILEQLAAGDGDSFAPDRALWVLDADVAPEQELVGQENAPWPTA